MASSSLPTPQHWEKTTQGTDLLTDNQRQTFEVINYVIICSAVGLFGIVTNVINVIVFFLEGFTTTVNISLFALAISDLSGLLLLEWFCLCMNPLFTSLSTLMVVRDVRYLTASGPHVYFARTSGWITAFVTAERCFCILFPLKVKQLVTPRRATVVLLLIFILNVLPLLPEYMSSYLSWNFYPDRNQTLLGLVFKENRRELEGLTYVLSAASGMNSFLVVFLFTVILVVKLKQQVQWRMKSVGSDQQRNSTSSRDKQTMSMVAAIAAILIGCYTPGVTCNILTFAVPGLSTAGRYSNVFYVMFSFCFILQAINSSINIFFYYTMSSKYRQKFHRLFSACSRM